MDSLSYFSKIVNTAPETLSLLDSVMRKKTGRTGIPDLLFNRAEDSINKIKKSLVPKNGATIAEMLRETAGKGEKELRAYMEKTIDAPDEFARATILAKRISVSHTGFFLKRDRAMEILKKRKPENLLVFLHLKNTDELFKKYDIAEAFSALRFVESDEWMHETFDKAYGDFTKDDFEEREVEIKVLGPEWMEIAEKFVAKKHHNVSHLKEFGVIFLNPIKEDTEGKFLRDFALLLHYFNEIQFYSKLFKMYANDSDFAEKLKSLLRGDVPQKNSVYEGEWLIIQRYLWKDNPADPRLFLPHVNPESLHWARAEESITAFAEKESLSNLALWNHTDWIAEVTEGGVISYDLEDNVMSLVSFVEKKDETLSYHEREALWTKLFEEYSGGREAMEKRLIESFMRGAVQF